MNKSSDMYAGFTPEQLYALLHALPDPAFIITASGRYAAIFGGIDARYYHDKDFLIGKRMRDVLQPEKAAWFEREIEKALDSGTLHIVEYQLAAADIAGLESAGPIAAIWFEARVQALDFPVDGEAAVLWVASNMTDRVALEERLRKHGEIDVLSGLYNRRKLLESLAQHHDTFTRYGTPMALVIFDVDHFKSINDNHGHSHGDDVIRATAEACRTTLRTTDIAARLGGDEFVVLMPHTRMEQAMHIVERLREAIGAALRATGLRRENATVSGGVAELLPGDVSGDDALKRADQALYQAKREGRDRVVGYKVGIAG